MHSDMPSPRHLQIKPMWIRKTIFILRVLLLKLRASVFPHRKDGRSHYDLILVKTGELGDYILFRDLLQSLRRSGTPGMRILLVGNRLWEQLSVILDRDLADAFLWVERDYADYAGTDIGLLEQLSRTSCDRLVNASFSRSPISDLISFLVTARTKYCPDDSSASRSFRAALRRSIYDVRVGMHGVMHESARNAALSEYLTGTDTRRERPALQIPQAACGGPALPEGPRIVISVGASDPRRRWPREKVRQLMGYLRQETDFEMLLVGSETDHRFFQDVMKGMPDRSRITDLSGRTTLPELLHVLKGATLVVSNETGIIHMADALDIPSVCILGGGHFRRFVPYPRGSGSRIEAAYEELPCYQCDWNCRHPQFDGSVYPCIAAVKTEKVISLVGRSCRQLPLTNT